MEVFLLSIQKVIWSIKITFAEVKYVQKVIYLSTAKQFWALCWALSNC